MIEVTLVKEKDNFKSLFMTGHSNMSKHGEDIVCASASILAFTLVNFLIEVTGISLEDLNFHGIENEENPIFSINIEKNEIYNNSSVQSAFQFFEIGILSLTEEYSDYIKLIYREV